MNGRLRWRFWVEAAMALLSSALCMITLIWQNWIETVFAIDPDRDSGSAEWLIVAVSFAITIIAATLARRAWRQRLSAT